MKTIILVRHGESETNVQKVFTGQLDTPLTEAGRLQADLMAKYLDRYQIQKVYASPLQRATDTARAIVKRQDCSLEMRESLKEIYAGLWEGFPFDVIAERYSEEYQIWKTDFKNAHPVGGESCAAVFQRAKALLQELLENTNERTVCVVTHAIPIRMIESDIECGTIDRAQDISWVPNASVTIYQYDGDFHRVLRGYCDYLGGLSTNLPKSI